MVSQGFESCFALRYESVFIGACLLKILLNFKLLLEEQLVVQERVSFQKMILSVALLEKIDIESESKTLGITNRGSWFYKT